MDLPGLLPKTLIREKEKRSVTFQRPAQSSAELIADEGRFVEVVRSEVIASIQVIVSNEFPGGSPQDVGARLVVRLMTAPPFRPNSALYPLCSTLIS